MILTSIGPDAPFHRAFAPRWAHAPESGAGAALAGGRFNRPGVQARYLAATTETALAEYQGESPLLPPITVNVVDSEPRALIKRCVGGAVMFRVQARRHPAHYKHCFDKKRRLRFVSSFDNHDPELTSNSGSSSASNGVPASAARRSDAGRRPSVARIQARSTPFAPAAAIN
jgi:hypothetical protein